VLAFLDRDGVDDAALSEIERRLACTINSS
jgi:hypothetical protein